MKPKLILCSFLLISHLSLLISQIPMGFNYQALAKDASLNSIANATIKVKLSVLTDTSGFYFGTGGVYLWEEEHTGVLTNAFGLFTVVLGSPSATQTGGSAASFSAIDWSLPNLYLGTKIAHPVYKVLGAAKLWSVPYALKAKDSEQWQTSGSNIYRSTGNVGIGISPADKLHVNGNVRIDGAISGQGATGSGTVLYIGNDSKLADINTANTVGIHGMQNEAQGGIKLGSSGPTLYGASNVLSVYANSMLINDGTGLAGTLKLAGHSWIGSADWGDLRIASGTNSGLTSIRFITENAERAYITGNGNMGIGVWPTEKLHVSGNALVTGNLSASFLGSTNMEIGGPAPTAVNGQATMYFHHHGAVAHQLRYTAGNFFLEAAGNGYGTTPTPALHVGGSLYAGIFGGNIGFGTSIPTSKVEIQPPSTWDDNTPLFEVKNKYGYPVLAVYNNGVRILVEDVDGKGGLKSGFAIGGFDQTKAGPTYDLMMISPDSIRMYIDNNAAKAGLKSGFAIGSFSTGKAVNPTGFMNITPQAAAKGQYNTFIGYQAGLHNKSTAVTNSFIGYQAGYSNVKGYSNVFIGYKAGYSNYGPVNIIAPNDGYNNVYIGTLAGEVNKGSNNVLMGDDAGKLLTNGFQNVYLGSGAGKADINGDYNTYIGGWAGRFETGSDNVMIGYDAGFGSGESDLLVIGNRHSRAFIVGDFANDKLKFDAMVGIGLPSGWPTVMLDVNGNGRFRVVSSGTYYAPLNITSDGTLTTTTSDLKMKKDIEPIREALEKVLGMNGVYFSWKNDISGSRKIGFVAQEMEVVLPEVVFTNPVDGLKGINYSEVTAVFAEAIKEQQMQIDQQKQQIESQNEKISHLEKIVEEMQAMIAGNR